MPPERGHPPAPGPFVQPDVSAIETAVRTVTFPISKKDLLDQINDESTVVLRGSNVDLHTLVKDLNDDYFESEDEFREALQDTYGHGASDAEIIIEPRPPTGFPEVMPKGAPGRTDQPHVPDDNP